MEDYSPLVIYMRRNTIGGIAVRHDQRYIDENSNYDHVWERFVPVTNIRNGYEFAFDEVNETIYWAQVKGYLPDMTPAVRLLSPCVLAGNVRVLDRDPRRGEHRSSALFLRSSMKFVASISMARMKQCSTAMTNY